MKSGGQQTPDWSNIHPDLLEVIQKKLPLPDILQFRSVCSKWRSTTKALLLSPLNPPPPILMLSRKFRNLFGGENYIGGGGESGSGDHLFLNLAAAAVNNDEEEEDSDEGGLASFVPMGKVTHGWIVSWDGHERFSLLNPSSFGSVSRLRFPPIEYPLKMHIFNSLSSTKHSGELPIPQKVIFWENPILGGERDSVMSILSTSYGFFGRLFYGRCGDRVYLVDGLSLLPINDIICINNCVYGVTPTGYLEAWDCSGGGGTKTTTDSPYKILSFQPKIDRKWPLADTYLVEVEGDILLVTRNTPEIFQSDPRKKFSIYKLDLDLKIWEALESLGDRVLLLLCEKQTMSLSTKEFPNYEKNSIYFVVSRTIYIFNLEDGSVKEAGSGTKKSTVEEIKRFWLKGSVPYWDIYETRGRMMLY